MGRCSGRSAGRRRGVIRNQAGRILQTYGLNLGQCSITRAELRGAVEGMRIAWDMRIRKLEIQLDSAAAVHILTARDLADHQHMALVHKFRNLQARNWETRIKHVYREANVLADYIADLDHSQPVGSLALGVQDSLLRYWTEHDLLEVAQPRAVLM
ncbi:Putative ribonuclease H protein At1g65750 [Linum grandiflorum]